MLLIPSIVLVLAWSVFIAVAVFRSGRAYQQQHSNKYWGRTAQVLACLGVLANLGSIPQLLSTGSTDADLDKIVADVNRSGVIQNTDIVHFDRVDRDGRTLVYHYIIIGPSHVLSSEDAEKTRVNAAKQMCASVEARQMLQIVDGACFEYANDQGGKLLSFVVSGKDCS